MNYKDNLAEIKAGLKFLELRKEQTLGKITIPKDFVIPISRESVKDATGGEFSFNFFHIVQNMLFCVSLCEDLPLNEVYHPMLINIFDKTDKKFLEVLLDLRLYEDELFKAGILLGYARYSNDADSYLRAASVFIDLYQSSSDDEYMKVAKTELLKSFKLEKKAYTAYLLSYVYHYEKDYELAIDYAERAVDLGADDTLKNAIEEDLVDLKLLLDIATTRELMASGDYLAALQYIMENKRDDSWEESYMIGEIYLALERPQEAMDNLLEALDLNPTEPDIYESLGIAAYFLGDVSNSIKFLEHGLKLDPKQLEILKNLATLYSKTGRSEIAIKLLEKSKAFYPDDEEVDVIIGRIKERLDA